MRALLFVVLMGCTGAPPVDPSNARAAALHMDVALDRAVDEHVQGHPDLARRAWRDAHLAWDNTLAPGLAQTLTTQEILTLELHLGRIRAEIEDPKGDPGAKVKAFDAALVRPLATLPGPPLPQP